MDVDARWNSAPLQVDAAPVIYLQAIGETDLRSDRQIIFCRPVKSVTRQAT